ncbi:MAG: 3'-5' exonuclease [Clostridiaceae bacterium]
MDYVIIDLEFNNLQGVYQTMNQYLNRENSFKRRLYPNEIIQIGAVRLGEDLAVVDGLNIMVKNTFYKTLNPMISEMTGVTQAMMDEGIGYPEAVKVLEEFCKGAVVLTWGVSDIYEIIRNCHMHQTPITVLGQRYLDLQAWIGQRENGNRTPSLKSIMELYDIEIDDNLLHDGYYDAQSTGRVLVAAIRKYGKLDSFKTSRVLFTSDSVFITDIQVRDVPDTEVTMVCPLCDGHIVYDISMTNEHGKIRSMYHCEDCKSSYLEDIQAKENMLGERTFFKKIKKVPLDYFRAIIAQRQHKRSEHY